VRERIRGYTEAVLEETGDVSVLAGGVAGFDQLLQGNDDLLNVMTDPGLADHVRRSVVTDLVSGRLGADAVRLLAFLTGADRPTDFAEDVAWLSERLSAAREGLVLVASGPLGRTGALERLDGYTTAVLEGVRADGGFDDLEDELFRFTRIVEGSEELSSALTARDVAAGARRGLVDGLLEGKARPATVRLARYATQVGRARDYVTLLDAVIERVAEESHRQVAEVRAPIPLDDEQRRRLAAALSRMIGHQVELRVVVDDTVLGGFVATIGDSVVDASARHRLEQLRDRLVLPDTNPSS
jgi:F-type H+-transporting ATPase subunit delta